jgi:hypothetical protein
MSQYYTFIHMADGSKLPVHKVCVKKFIYARVETILKKLFTPDAVSHSAIRDELKKAEETKYAELVAGPIFAYDRGLKSVLTRQLDALVNFAVEYTAGKHFATREAMRGERLANEGEEKFVNKLKERVRELIIKINLQMFADDPSKLKKKKGVVEETKTEMDM